VKELYRLLLWEYPRESLAYELLWAVMIGLLLLVSPETLGDPMRVGGR
jgi:hypothetical protein